MLISSNHLITLLERNNNLTNCHNSSKLLSVEARLALLSFSSLCLCLELRIVIGIILSPALESVSRGRSEAVEDVMMVFSSIMAAWQRLFFTQGCSYICLQQSDKEL
jgi:hypothetical protein